MLNLLINRRSIRKYKDQEVEKEKIDIIIKGALTSPSSKNRMPWDLVVVEDKELLAKLAASRGGASHPIANAPLAIVVLGDPNVSELWVEDTSIMATNIQLLAQSLGLGSCWIQARQRLTKNEESVEDYIKEALDIPAKYCVECILSIGYPDEEKTPHNEDTLNYDKVHYNKF